MLLIYFISLIVFIILIPFIAMFAPEVYALISEEKLVFIVVLSAYFLLWQGLRSAYLQRSQITGKEIAKVEDKPIEKAYDLHSNTDIPDVW